MENASPPFPHISVLTSYIYIEILSNLYQKKSVNGTAFLMEIIKAEKMGFLLERLRDHHLEKASLEVEEIGCD